MENMERVPTSLECVEDLYMRVYKVKESVQHLKDFAPFIWNGSQLWEVEQMCNTMTTKLQNLRFDMLK